MRIVVVGAGKLGYSIAELLSKEAFDVVLVDQDAAQLEGPKNTLDVLTIHANGASPDHDERAGHPRRRHPHRGDGE